MAGAYRALAEEVQQLVEQARQDAECARLMPAKWTFKRVEIPPDHPYEKPVMIDGSY